MSNSSTINWRQLVGSGDRIFIGSYAAVPNALIQDLINNARDLHDIEVVHVLTTGDNAWTRKEYSSLFKVNSLFIGQGSREAVAQGYADYTPCFQSEIPKLFEDGTLLWTWL